MSNIQKEDLTRVQNMLKSLSPTAKEEDSVAIKDIPTHCARIISQALNLEWFGHTGKAVHGKTTEGSESPKRNFIVVRVEELDMSLSAFTNKILEILKRLS